MGQYHEIWAFDPTGEHPPEHVEHYPFGAGAKLGEQSHLWNGEEWGSGVVKHQYPPGVQTASPYCMAVGLMAMGPWAGRHLVVIGDYAEPGDVTNLPGDFTVDQYYGMAEVLTRGYLDKYPDEYGPGARQLAHSVRNVTEFAQNMLAEATGLTTQEAPHGGAWKRSAYPDDWSERVKTFCALDDDDEYVISSSHGEYLDPKMFGSPRVRMSMPLIGAVWPVVNGMLACSDGRGGGDLRLDPVGRWANSMIGCIPLATAHELELTDVSQWALSQERIIDWVIGGN